MSVASLVTGTQLCEGSPAFQRPLCQGRWATPTERETARHCLPSAWWAEKGTEALAAEEGRPWVRASRTLLVTAGPTKRALFTPSSYTCSLQGGGQRKTESGSPCEAPGRKLGAGNWKKGTLEPLWGPPSSSQAKTGDVEKAQITLDLVPLPARDFDSFSYFIPLCSMLCFELLLFKIKSFFFVSIYFVRFQCPLSFLL